MRAAGLPFAFSCPVYQRIHPIARTFGLRRRERFRQKKEPPDESRGLFGLLYGYQRRFVFFVAMMVNTPKAMLSAAQMYKSE